ncbi:hypothetical protein PORY_001721 [Pneumocystis oryctolagi]|uniref:Uncharacterized protein n=1 Tax=Pneumocystis oryctolagi TaxID=42067 RepID=A0ACB7CBQ4_9ASCO|nr:hypothetical protein PORY_001721 [Pneumocystis oryctolagi]
MGDVFYIIYSFIGFLCSIIPSVWHWKYRNIAPLCLIFWVSLSNLICFLNSIIWFHGIEAKYTGYIYCDVAIKLTLAATSGELGAVAAISHYLSRIMKPMHSSMQTKIFKRRQAIEDLFMSFTCPVIIVCLHYIVQSARYVIDGINGCVPWSDRSWPAVLIILIWPPILGTIGAYYSVKVIFLYFKKQKKFQSILKDSKSSITLSRFIRLIGICSLLITVYLPLNIYALYTNVDIIIKSNIKYSWQHVHQWHQKPVLLSNNNVSFNRWLVPSNGIVIFIFFGMGSDAIVMYKEMARKLYIIKCFDFFKKIFKRKTKNTENSQDYYNSYDFEKSLDRCPPLFYNQIRDARIIDSDSLTDYSSILPVYTDYNRSYNFTDVPVYSHSRNNRCSPFEKCEYEFQNDKI